MNRLLRLTGFVLFVGFVVLFGARSSDVTITAHAQQEIMLDRRISQIEQRFYTLESRLNQLESASRYGSSSSSVLNRNDSELRLMRAELDRMRADMDLLKTRVGDVECAMFKLDERTLSSAARTIRRKTEPDTNEGCRADFNSPIQLSTRR